MVVWVGRGGGFKNNSYLLEPYQANTGTGTLSRQSNQSHQPLSHSKN